MITIMMRGEPSRPPVGVVPSAAPVVLAANAVSKDVPKGSLYVARAKERILEGWVERRGLLKKKDK